MYRFLLPAGSALLATMFLVGAAHAQNVKLGSLSAVTGPIPALVAKIVKGEQHAVDQINEAGGVLGGELELIIADSQCDAKAAVDAATKLVHVDQVTAIVGAICSGGTLGATQSVTIPAGVVSVSPSATAPVISGLEDNDLVYRVAPSDVYQGVALAELARSLGYDSVAMTFTNDAYNTGLATVFRDAFTSMGGTIAGDQMHEPNKASYRAELATLAQGEVDALVLFAYYDGSGILIMRQSLENGFFDKFLGADGMVDPSVIEQLGADSLAGNTIFTAAASDEGSDSFMAFDESITAAGGDARSPYVAQGFDAAMLLALAVEHAGSTDRGAIAASLRAVASGPGEVVGPGDWARAVELIRAGTAINYQGASGSCDFDENGDVAGIYNRNDVGASGMFEASRL